MMIKVINVIIYTVEIVLCIVSPQSLLLVLLSQSPGSSIS